MKDKLFKIKQDIYSAHTIPLDMSFELSKICTAWLADPKTENYAREIIIRILDAWNKVDKSTYPIWNDIVEASGLYPYLDKKYLESESSLLRLEYHKSKYLNYHLHEEQMDLSLLLEAQKSLIVSAPTSFGKSLLIEEIIASKRYKNIVVIQPTLALLDETRKKLRKYQNHYKIIVSTHQTPSDGPNLFLLTGERVVEYDKLPKIDFFVIDEFYKLSMDRDDERASALNLAFYKLLKMTKNFYLLGPNIEGIPMGFESTYNAKFIKSIFSTVAVDVNKMVIVNKKQREEILFKLLLELEDPTLIYCRSPARVNDILSGFVDFCRNKKVEPKNESELKEIDIVEWIDKNIHPNWMLNQGLRYFIGIHHGGLTRHIASTMVDYFNKGKIKYLFCTSTLIEGVNTNAKNVILLDERKGIKLLDFFDFKNIVGRSGRFKKHFIGSIYQFYPEPYEKEIQVDIPFFTQDKAESELLVQLDPNDIKDKNSKLYKLIDSLEPDLKKVIQSNKGVPIEGQLKVYESITKNLKEYHSLLNWKGYPSYKQLVLVLQLAWDNLLKKGESRGIGFFSAKQLALMTIRYASTKSMKGLIAFMFTDQFLQKKYPHPKDRLQAAINSAYQLRNHWFEYKLPKLIKTVSTIQSFVYGKNAMEQGDYTIFAAQVENSFLPENLSILLEYDIPVSAVNKLIKLFKGDLSVDQVLEKLKKIDLEKTNLLSYEKNKIKDSI